MGLKGAAMFRIITDGARYREHVLLKDGLGVLLRIGTAEDVPAVADLMRRVSQETLQMRFMGSVAEVSESTVRDMCTGQLTDRGCVLALVGEDDDRTVVGVGNYIGFGNGRTAEVAFLVDDAYQGRGISTLLLERLAGLAAAQGYVAFQAEVLFENQAMMGVFRSSGFDIHQGVEEGVFHVELPVGGAAALRERTELRERIAVAASLKPVLRPRTVAVVGASREPDAIGNLIFRHILHAGFPGTVYPVNPRAESVHGVRAFPSATELPEPVDLAVIAVPASTVIQAAEQAVYAGAKALVVVSSGFAETGAEGAERQQQLVQLVRAHGVRLVGPNCLGIMNTDPEVHLNATLATGLAPRGRVGLFSHSGALGLVILEHAAERGVGLSTFVAAGNRAELSGNDLLLYWEEDAATDVAILYLETFGNPRRFTRIARRMSHRKPIVCIKSARTRAGQVAAGAGGGVAFGSEVQVEALFQQAGLIRAETLEEMFDVAVLLANQPLPRGHRVAAVSNSRGAATLFVDAGEAEGLELAGPGISDLGPLASPEEYEDAVRTALEHEEVDAVFVSFACVGECTPDPVGRAVRRAAVRAQKHTGVAKPVLLCLMGHVGAVRPRLANRQGAEREAFPSYRFPEEAAHALGRVVRYARYLQRKPGALVWYDDVDSSAARQRVHALLADVTTKSSVTVTGTAATELAGQFNLACSGSGFDDGDPVRLNVRTDDHFGPLIELRRGETLLAVRLTPLSDRDVAETVAAVGLPERWDSDELLGRVSQMIEELPWLHAMQATVVVGAREGSVALASDLTIELRPSGAIERARQL